MPLFRRSQPTSTSLWVYIATDVGASGPYSVAVAPNRSSATISLSSGIINPPFPFPTSGVWGGNVTLTYITPPTAATVPSPAVIDDPISIFAIRHPWFEQVLEQITSSYNRATTTGSGLNRAFAQYNDLYAIREVPTSGPIDRMFLEVVLEELRVQESLEDRWQNLVRTVAPEAGDQQSVFQLLKLVIVQAQHDAEQLGNPFHFGSPTSSACRRSLSKAWRRSRGRCCERLGRCDLFGPGRTEVPQRSQRDRLTRQHARSDRAAYSPVASDTQGSGR
jgi:hypothetical protein